MSHPQASRWPPLIPASRAPWPLRLRDTVLTVAAWILLVWVLRDAVFTLIAGISPAAAAWVTAWLAERLDPLLGPINPLGPAVFWQQLKPYLVVAGGVVAWLAAWGWFNRAALRRQPDARAAEGALHVDAGTSASTPPAWHGARRLQVRFDADGRIVEPLDGPKR